MRMQLGCGSVPAVVVRRISSSSFSFRVVDPDVEHEPVELRLGERVGAFLFDRVLGGEHEERLVQRVGRVAGRDPLLLHGLEQGGLGLRRRPVDFVGQEQVAEDGPVDESGTPSRRLSGSSPGRPCR